MNVLAIDTSTNVLGVALANEKGIIGEYVSNMSKNHSVRAMPAIELLLSSCDMKPANLDKIVVAKGPGSYTGVRIGVTIAKTLAWSLGIELTGISSLEALASNGRLFNGYICPLFDARRGQIYTTLFKSENGQLVRQDEDRIVLSSEWVHTINKLEQRVLFLGTDLPLHENILVETLAEQAVFPPAALLLTRPGELALLGMNRPSEEIHGFTPNYVRMAEAEAKWLEAQTHQLKKEE